MALNFPNSPSDGDIYAVSGITYRYNSAIGAWLILPNVITGNLSLSGTISGNTAVIAGSMNVEPTVQAVFGQANTIYLHANSAYNQANTARDQANISFSQANTASNIAIAAFNKANTGGGGITYIKKTSNYTANAGDGIIADTSTGSFNVTLPATPNVGTQIVIVDGNNWAANTLVVLRNGSTIEDVAEDLTLDVAGTSVTFIYDGTTWETYFQLGISSLGTQNIVFNMANAAFLQANNAYAAANAALDSALAFAIALG